MTQGDEIRILDLLPGQQDAELRCELRVVSSNDEPQYEALSYVWGPGLKDCVAYVDSLEVKITDNLHDALRRLRDPSEKRVLWLISCV